MMQITKITELVDNALFAQLVDDETVHIIF